MQITLEYAAQVKQAAGTARETLDVAAGCTVQQLVCAAAERHGEAFRRLVLNGDGQLQRSLLLFVGDDQIRWETPIELRDADVVMLLSPVSGG